MVRGTQQPSSSIQTSHSAAAGFAMVIAAAVMAVRPAISIKMFWNGLL
jgi:hypothetical protein